MRCADEVYAILDACFEVYTRMGCGFLEAVYFEREEYGPRNTQNTRKKREYKQEISPHAISLDSTFVSFRVFRGQIFFSVG
ncbi:MAG: GxxExxY protein [Thermodesulfobacteriota bacterium]